MARPDVRRTLARTLIMVLAVVATSVVCAQVLEPLGRRVSTRVDERFMTIGNHFFAPDVLTVQVGVPVRFHVVHAGPEGLHDFLIVAGSHDRVIGGRAEIIAPGEHFTFDWVPTERGTFRIVCAVCPGEEQMVVLVHVV